MRRRVFLGSYDVLDAPGEVVEAWDSDQCHVARDRALTEAKGHSEVAVEDLARCTIAMRGTRPTAYKAGESVRPGKPIMP